LRFSSNTSMIRLIKMGAVCSRIGEMEHTWSEIFKEVNTGIKLNLRKQYIR
jgi:hypothetical protein